MKTTTKVSGSHMYNNSKNGSTSVNGWFFPMNFTMNYMHTLNLSYKNVRNSIYDLIHVELNIRDCIV